MIATTPGTLVRFRERKWIVLASDDPNLVLLRPIGGSARNDGAVYYGPVRIGR